MYFHKWTSIARENIEQNFVREMTNVLEDPRGRIFCEVKWILIRKNADYLAISSAFLRSVEMRL